MKRRFFQIHLLTAVVGMLSAAVVLYLNLHPRRTYQVMFMPALRSMGVHPLQHLEWGWPYTMAASNWQPRQSFGIHARDSNAVVLSLFGESKLDIVITNERFDDFVQWRESRRGYITWADVQNVIPEIRSQAETWSSGEMPLESIRVAEFSGKEVAINIVVALIILIVVMVAIEWLLRRRERMKV